MPTGSPPTQRTPGRPARLALAGLALAAVTLAGCSPVQPTHIESVSRPDAFGSAADPAAVRDGGTLVFGLSTDPDKLDPTLTSSLVSKHVFASFCESLYAYDADSSITPQLAAELPEISADGTVYTIRLREDAVFADGDPLTADAVVTTFERNLELPTSQRRSELGPVLATEALDEHTVRITLAEPYAPFASVLADRPGMILSPRALAELGEDFGDAPVCVGPFRYTDRVAGTSISVSRDPLYYDADAVHLDRIEYRVVPDANIRAANLQSGAVQVADNISPQDIGALDADPAVEVLTATSPGFQGIHLNLGNTDGIGAEPVPLDTPLAQLPLVRQAFSLGVDRASLARAVFGGWYDPACGPLADSSPYATEASQACPDHDPERARELLTEAGVEIPFRIELKVPNQQDPLRYAQALKADAAEAGFDIAVVPTEFATLLTDADNGNYQAALLGWFGRPDPDGNLRSYMATRGSSNYTGYTNPRVDAWLDEATASDDPARRAAIYGELTRTLNEDLPYVYLYRQRTLVAVSQASGVRLDPVGVVRPAFAGLEQR
ncbi:ABC transporter substrate-binding protein [Streptomyces sp. DSM 44915]|uniref:ABC transporter substrate-binding protein n=1 Tax=Streptomyces chisholmiae TaxID=3075540 RepID=A0ABU2JLY1_9ACTN|nr:ABC transporter substrate-binding protein [Streptomyces sp. DSM 44915]MDT0265991.1 ABC transporter substrate-binding protein [Streptomyces sp. DSM 44915]